MVKIPSEEKKKTRKTLKEKIAAAQEKVIQLHKPYEAAIVEPQALLDQKDECRKEKLWEAFMRSERDFKQVMTFLKTPAGEWDDDMEW